MKRIYASLALLGGIIGTASAQTIDYKVIPVIQEDFEMSPTGQAFSIAGIFDETTPGGDTVTAAVLYAIDGGSSMFTGDIAFCVGPFSRLDAEGLWGFNYPAPDDFINDEGEVPSVFTIAPVPVSDSIKTLLNIAKFEADSTLWSDILVTRASLVEGQTYGWYGYIEPGDDLEETDWSDNLQYIPIIWGAGSTGLGDLIRNTKLTPLEIYPNPTVETVSFVLEYTKVNKSAIARVLDVTGRIVSTSNLGSANAGKQKYSVDVAQLPSGSYSIQVVTDNTISVEKFVKK